MRHLFVAFLGAVWVVVALAVMNWSLPPPPSMNEHALAVFPNHASGNIVDARSGGNLNVYYNAVKYHQPVFFPMQFDAPSAVPAPARFTPGTSTPGPMPSPNVYDSYVERVNGEAFAKPAVCRHPMRC